MMHETDVLGRIGIRGIDVSILSVLDFVGPEKSPK
jgi:hypothetical protein